MDAQENVPLDSLIIDSMERTEMTKVKGLKCLEIMIGHVSGNC